MEALQELLSKGGWAPDALLEHIKHGDTGAPVLSRLRQAVSIGETYFFRNPQQLTTIAKVVDQRIIAPKRERGSLTLRAWSAGCSTGEEAYTLAVLLQALAPDFSIRVVGTDLNTDALQVARRGHYLERSVRRPLPALATEKIVRVGRGWEVTPDVRKLVKFVPYNLVTQPLPSRKEGLHGFDVVLLRHVLIYLDEGTVPRVMQSIASCCAPRSVLALTSAEYRASGYAPGFEHLMSSVLVRAPKESARAPASTTEFSPDRTPALSPTASDEGPKRGHLSSMDADLKLLQSLREVVNRGGDEALEIGAQLTRHQPQWALPCFLLGEAAAARRQWAKAISHYEAALVRDPCFVAAALRLGTALRRQGRVGQAHRQFEATLQLLAKRPIDEHVPELDVSVKVAQSFVREAQDEGRSSS
jgi:chemotaxis protein methyltransferase CheR